MDQIPYIDETSTPIPDIVLLFDTLSMYSLGWRNNTGTILFNHMILCLVHLWRLGLFPSTPYTTGTFEYSHMMYIPVGEQVILIFGNENVQELNGL